MFLDAVEMLRAMTELTHAQNSAASVTDFVWIGARASRVMDAHVYSLLRRPASEHGPIFEPGTFVLPEGWLLIALITDRGAFVFRVEPGGWGWIAQPA